MNVFLASYDEQEYDTECYDIEAVGTDYSTNKYFDVIVYFPTVQ